MVDWVTVILSIIGALIVAFLGPYYTHKLSIKYFKKEYFFKEKIALFEKIGGITWKNHLVLTTIESINESNQMNETNKAILKSQLVENIKNFAFLMEKLIYFSSELRLNFGRYISLLEIYANDKKFGEKEMTKKLREDTKPYMQRVNKIIEKEIKEIN